MTSQTIEIRKLTPAIGAEILGVNLAQDLNGGQFRQIHDALLDNLVIFFRDQKLSPQQHKEFARCFGELHLHPNAPRPIAEHPEILVIKADETSKRVAGEDWHSDVSCDAEPPMGSILYMHETPSNGGGDTLFASMYAAYEALSGPMQRFLESCTAIHDSGKAHTWRQRAADRADMEFPRSEHPVVTVHPQSGRKVLFVNRGFTTRIPQLRREEGDALLEMLFRHVEKPEFHCRFKWQPGSIAFWDNRCAQHHAMWDYHPLRRYGHRVTICGEKPIAALAS